MCIRRKHYFTSLDVIKSEILDFLNEHVYIQMYACICDVAEKLVFVYMYVG